MTYVAQQRVPDGVLLFHTLTRAFLLLSAEEYENLYHLPELYEKWFLVPNGLNDTAYADKVRFVRKAFQKPPEHITRYTIFTTTDCNARCFYCYELGRSRIPMSDETAHKTADYIKNHCGNKKVQLHWFGGEPLFNKNAIRIICTDLAAAGVEFSSKMTSNGYLFDAETVDEAARLWHLKSVQITLDGTEDVYNRTKAYIRKTAESPYQRVLGNIARLLAADVSVVVRMNMDHHNAENLLLLTDELHDRFANRKILSVYSHVLFDADEKDAFTRTDEDRKALYRAQRILCDRLKKFGLKAEHTLNRKIPLTTCMADSGDARTVLPNGELGLCEHYSENRFVGHICSEQSDAAVIKQFEQVRESEPACADCLCYPECIRLKECAEQTACFPEIKAEKERAVLSAMQYTYRLWKNRQAEPDEAFFENC